MLQNCCYRLSPFPSSLSFPFWTYRGNATGVRDVAKIAALRIKRREQPTEQPIYGQSEKALAQAMALFFYYTICFTRRKSGSAVAADYAA